MIFFVNYTVVYFSPIGARPPWRGDSTISSGGAPSCRGGGRASFFASLRLGILETRLLGRVHLVWAVFW
nr:MAG TPA: hypothetical protein [Bacteriophage sp.]